MPSRAAGDDGATGCRQSATAAAVVPGRCCARTHGRAFRHFIFCTSPNSPQTNTTMQSMLPLNQTCSSASGAGTAARGIAAGYQLYGSSAQPHIGRRTRNRSVTARSPRVISCCPQFCSDRGSANRVGCWRYAGHAQDAHPARMEPGTVVLRWTSVIMSADALR